MNLASSLAGSLLAWTILVIAIDLARHGAPEWKVFLLAGIAMVLQRLFPGYKTKVRRVR